MSLSKTCLAALSGLGLAAPVVAQEVSGTITGTLDLEPATWYVTSADGESESGWWWDGNEVVVRIVGQVRRDTATPTDGALIIALRTEGNPTAMTVGEFIIGFTPDDAVLDDPDYTGSAPNAFLDLETLFISGDEMAIAGSFAGRMILGGADELVLEDDIPDITVDGNFQATISRVTDPSRN